jgi:hypothetical protein
METLLLNRQSSSKYERLPVVQITMPQTDENRFAVELRAIGQALEKFKLNRFKIAQRSGVYTITGDPSADLQTTFSLIQFIREFVRGGKLKSSSAEAGNQIELTYSRPEIEVLDAQERAKRLEVNKLPDPYGVSQVLRGVGALLDNRQAASVLAIDYQEQWVTILYEKRDGRIEEEKQNFDYLYDIWVKMYLRRSNRPAPDQSGESSLKESKETASQG